ncbi:MAG: DUF3696 domain-containing protein [Polyangiaceae bacterium]
MKAFLTKGDVLFAPITLIAGTNSSGKSTIFQTLLLLKQAFEHPGLSLDGMHLNGPRASVGAYHDWCSKHDRANVDVTVELTNEPLLKLKRLRNISNMRSIRRATAPVMWWSDRAGYGRRYRLDSSAVSAELGLTFSPSDTSPNDARLKRVFWTSTSTRGDESSGYKLSVDAAMPTEEELDAAELDSDNDAERYRYSMTATRTWPVADSPFNVGPVFCAVEGLLPTTVLSATDDPAATMTILDMVTNVFTWARSTGRSQQRQDGDALGATELGRYTEALFSPTKHRLNTLAARVKRANEHQASAILLGVGELRLARLVLDRFQVSWKRDTRTDEGFDQAARSAADALLNMVLRLIASRAGGPTDDSVPDGIEASAARILEKLPDLDLPVKFLLDAMKLSQDSAQREQITAALNMALQHAAVDRHYLQPTRVEGVTRNLYPESSQVVVGAPSEDAVRKFFVDGLFHLGPLRDEPRVLYVADVPLAPHDVGKRGQRAISCLREFGGDLIDFPSPPSSSEDAASLKTDSIRLSEAVSLWGQFLGIFDGLQIDTSEKYGTVVKVKGSMDGTGIAPDLTNVGVGVSQVLPILVLCAAMPVGGCALIEQPELHLHPSVQSKLAVFFAACAASGRQVVLESHSEHLVNRMRLMVAQDDLALESVSLVFVERDEFGATVVPIRIQSDGSLERWPRGFLDEAESVLGALMRARKKIARHR